MHQFQTTIVFLVLPSFAARRDELFVCSGKGFLHRITWDGCLEDKLSMPIHTIPFTNDLENVRGMFMHRL